MPTARIRLNGILHSPPRDNRAFCNLDNCLCLWELKLSALFHLIADGIRQVLGDPYRCTVMYFLFKLKTVAGNIVNYDIYLKQRTCRMTIFSEKVSWNFEITLVYIETIMKRKLLRKKLLFNVYQTYNEERCLSICVKYEI